MRWPAWTNTTPRRWQEGNDIAGRLDRRPCIVEQFNKLQGEFPPIFVDACPLLFSDLPALFILMIDIVPGSAAARMLGYLPELLRVGRPAPD